jgi:hypothetical protein
MRRLTLLYSKSKVFHFITPRVRIHERIIIKNMTKRANPSDGCIDPFLSTSYHTEKRIKRAQKTESDDDGIESLSAIPPELLRLMLPSDVVPPPETIYRTKAKPAPLLAYSYFIHRRPPPEESGCKTWAEFATFISALVYRSPDWCRYHEMFITASGAGSLLGINEYVTARKEFQNLRNGKKLSTAPFQLFAMCRGLHCEPFIRMMYAKAMNNPNNELRECPTMMHPKYPWIIATPDGQVFDKKTGNLVRNLEWKTPYSRPAARKIPPEYMLQVQLTMAVTGAKECDFGSFKMDNKPPYDSEFIVHRVYRSNDYIEFAIYFLEAVCRSFHAGNEAPTHYDGIEFPEVRSEMILRINDAVNSVDGGREIVDAAIAEAWKEAKETASKNFLINNNEKK